NDTGIGFEEVVAAHAGFAGDAAGDDDEGAAGRGSGVVGAGDLGVETFEAGGFHHVERLALRHTFDDVDHGDVGELFFGDALGGGRADEAGSENGDFRSE